MANERFMRAFHATSGITSRVFARGGSYTRLADRVATDVAHRKARGDEARGDEARGDEARGASVARVPAPRVPAPRVPAPRVPAPRVLDLGCDDGLLVKLLHARGCTAIGIDLTRGDVIARAQQLPFADRSFDAVTSHLSFMLFDDIEHVVTEIDRVLAPGGTFYAVLGGGPTAHGHDDFHRFLEIANPRGRALGDQRAKSEAGWRELFAYRRPASTSGSACGEWRTTFERWEIDLSGDFDEVWQFFASSYDDFDHQAARTAMTADRLECRVVLFLATATR